MKRAKNQGMVARSWWALLRKPDGLPVLFNSKSDAQDNCDYDEYVVPVLVRPSNLLDLARGERAVREASQAKPPSSSVKLRGFGTKKRRPRLPVEKKRRRGSALNIGGLGPLRQALKEVAPKVRQRLADGIESRSYFAGMDLAKGPDSSAEIRVTKGKVVSHRVIKKSIKKGAKSAAAPRARR
jgi:hypothetical protein